MPNNTSDKKIHIGNKCMFLIKGERPCFKPKGHDKEHLDELQIEILRVMLRWNAVGDNKVPTEEVLRQAVQNMEERGSTYFG